MKIVVTGASGFVGRLLVPHLRQAGAELLLAGRDKSRLFKLFPDYMICDYGELPERAMGWDQVIHLAVANSDAVVSETEFHQTNVVFLQEVAEVARQIGIKRFVNISSVHALDIYNTSEYADSKRKAVQVLESMEGMESRTVYLPMVYGEEWTSGLKLLNRLPLPVAKRIFPLLASLKPTVHIKLVSDFIVANHPRVPGAEFIISDTQLGNIWFNSVKRIFDVLAALSILILFGWALVLISLLVRIQTPGPAIFRQRRIGRHGREFVCYKFRTMQTGTVQAGTHQVSASAVTVVGRLLRRTKLDELPQIWNVLRNELSLIGPRPSLPIQHELIEARRLAGVLDIKPGITGLAQVNGVDMSDTQRLVRWDARYLALQSHSLDLSIALATIRGKGNGDRVGR